MQSVSACMEQRGAAPTGAHHPTHVERTITKARSSFTVYLLDCRDRGSFFANVATICSKLRIWNPFIESTGNHRSRAGKDKTANKTDTLDTIYFPEYVPPRY
jgi:hypothetical protein